jgi:hypothetical protein
MSMSLFPRPPGAAEELPPRGSVLFDRVRAAQPGLLPLDQEPDPDDTNQIAKDLVAPGLPVSKSGAPFFPPPPQPSLVPPSLSRSWLDIASLVAPNLVEYFTKQVPPQAPFPSTPGKIPSSDFNPYAGPALVDAANLATMLLPGVPGLAEWTANRIAMMGAKALQGRALAGTTLARGIAAIGREGEDAVGIPANAPKPSIWITSSGTWRFPDRVTEKTIEDVKNVRYLAFTQQLMDYLEHAQENNLSFILHVRPDTRYSGTLQNLIDAGQIELRYIPRRPK